MSLGFTRKITPRELTLTEYREIAESRSQRFYGVDLRTWQRNEQSGEYEGQESSTKFLSLFFLARLLLGGNDD